MSDGIDDAIKKAHEDHMDLEKRKLELQKNEIILREHRVKQQITNLERNASEMAIAESTDFSRLTDQQIADIQFANDDYMEASKNSMEFINEEFEGIVPFFRKNLIFIGAPTGNGKSTTVANIVYNTIRQRRTDGTPRRVLVITNEEQREDVYNRITCLAKGWNYVNHNKFTDEQRKAFKAGIGAWARNGWVTVIDNAHNGAVGSTTTVEGLRNIFADLIPKAAKGEYFDAIIIDYYQNFKESKLNPMMNEWAVQAAVVAALDQYKNIYPGPIVLLGQVNKLKDDDDKTPFEFRIKGRKSIVDSATCILEMLADRENYRTIWRYHKGRFNEFVGKEFYTGFSKGAFVPYNRNFIISVHEAKEQRMMDKTSGGALKKAMEGKKAEEPEKAVEEKKSEEIKET